MAAMLFGTGDVDAVNEAELLPAAMLTAAGREAEAALLERLSAMPPVGAGPDRVMLQVLADPPIRVAGAQAKEETNCRMVIDVLTEEPL